MSKIYLIATPIGNKKDISLRALERLFSLDVLFCEDTRKTKTLLDFYTNNYQTFLQNGKMPKLISYFEHNENQRISLIEKLVSENKKIALVSNAGTPTVSDPGFRLTEFAKKNNIEVTILPGACAFVSAWAVSGLPTDNILFLGFLPRKISKQEKIWKDIKKSEIDKTVVFYESPFRFFKTLEGLKKDFGNIEITVAREMTKKFEEIVCGKIDDINKYFKKGIKGEIVLLFRFEA